MTKRLLKTDKKKLGGDCISQRSTWLDGSDHQCCKTYRTIQRIKPFVSSAFIECVKATALCLIRGTLTTLHAYFYFS